MIGDNSLFGPLDPALDAGHEDHPPRMGFFTDTSICIGCKACEVACKEWNLLPEDGLNFLDSSYDHTGSLSASSWRHVAFIEQRKPLGQQDLVLPPASDAAAQAVNELVASGGTQTMPAPVDLGMPGMQLPGKDGDLSRGDFRWLMESNVCKHCTHAACLDVCPTGSLFRTEFGTVVVQPDICNGCGYCIPACPYGVIDQRKQESPTIGLAQKCTLCYDRLKDDLTPACAKACPTNSIQFGPLDELRERADARLAQLHDVGVADAQLYGNDPEDGVGGAGAFFLLLDEPEVYGMPPDPVVTTRDLPAMWRRAGLASLAMVVTAVVAFSGGRR